MRTFLIVAATAGGVVVVLPIALAIVIPAFLRSPISSNEASAIASLRDIAGAEEAHKKAPGGGYSPLAGLAGPGPGGIDAALAAGEKNGYRFAGGVDAGRNFTFHAAPSKPGATGRRWFFLDATGTVRFNGNGPATAGSPAIE